MREEIHLEDGKYTVVLDQTNGFEFYAMRYNEKWRNLSNDGDKLILALFQECRNLKEQVLTAYELNGKTLPTKKIELAGDKEFHVAFWKHKGMTSGINVRAAHMAEAIQKACESGIDPCLIIYAHAKDSVYPVL